MMEHCGKMISNIVFTKNRPLQLEAYLESLYRYFPSELIKTHILYKVELFEQEYELLFQKYPDCEVVKEADFHSDFLRILSRVDTKYILFGIDDVVYFDSVDFAVIDEAFVEHPEEVFGFSLRFDIGFLKEEGDSITDVTAAGEPSPLEGRGERVYRLDWRGGRTPYSRYPFELCATIYPTALVKKVVSSVMNNNPLVRGLFSPGSVLIRALGKVVSTRSILKPFGYFYSPNTLESWNCRWCQNHGERLPGFLYFQKLCASAVQVNMVNVTTKNIFDGTAEHTVETLNDKYKQGYRLDIDFVAGNKPKGTHCGQEHFRLLKSV